MAEIDSREFRNWSGHFATGVTVLTVQVGNTVRGMTANAFSSLSLHPPLILVCIQHGASMHPMFEVAEAFGVNILAADQKSFSALFAQHGEHAAPMGGVPYRIGALGVPILEGVMGWAQCRVEARYAGGDHMIVVGRVEEMAAERPEAAPLLFYAGQYRTVGEAL